MIAKFVDGLERLVDADSRLGIAVSGGPDSIALLLLAHAARPGRIKAATVDHGLRKESADEARMVAALCSELAIPHEVLVVEVAPGNLQANARTARYAALGKWVDEAGIDALLTAHHADDQAETLLMRLNRGSGIAGLAGVRARAQIPGHGGALLRPLLEWRKAELEEVVADAGIEPAHDPSNDNEDFDRVRMRKALAEAEFIDAIAISKSAAHLAQAQQALESYADAEWDSCVTSDEDRITYKASAPRAVRLMVLRRAIEALGTKARGGAVSDLLDALERGEGGNVAGVLVTSEKERWVLRCEPPRR